MSDEQGQADVPEPRPGESISPEQHAKFHWGVPISAERQQWLRRLADNQREWAIEQRTTRVASAFTGRPLTGADVFWLAEASGRDESDGVLHLETLYVNTPPCRCVALPQTGCVLEQDLGTMPSISSSGRDG
jgi:hypothetical protein